MTNLPSGTITFLFTDIEGSTKLWETQPLAMQAALIRHDVLLRNAIETANGVVFKTVGDAFCAAFASALDALDAAFAAQSLLFAEPWNEAATIRVRMALHTGTVEERDNDYFGPVLNRVARLLSAGHGGQILVSAPAYELTRDRLPHGIVLSDLGLHRLKDLERPEHVFQVSAPGLPAAFAPLKTLDDTPNNLPSQLTSFIGREKPIASATALLSKTRLLTLTGSGGSGKTRLSLQVAADQIDTFADGVWQVELAPLSDASLVAQTVAFTLGIKEQAGQNLTQTLISGLKNKTLLILLDNCEHLIDVCAALATALLRACPGVKILATGREALGIAGEQTYRIPSLSLPDTQSAKTATPESLSQFEAVRLFIERARAVKPDFAVTNANAPALAQLCTRLDGIPLALELASARIRSLTVEQINERLSARFRLLTGGDRSAVPRQQTLRALVDWSYELLTDTEKTLFARLSIFAGGWTLEAAENVCGIEPVEDWEVLDLLTSLADKSLVVAEAEMSGETRYAMLETLRQYGTEKRDSGDDGDNIPTRHLHYFAAFIEAAELRLIGPEQLIWLNRLEAEQDNARAAFEWCVAVAASGNVDGAGVRLAGALGGFWLGRGYYSEGREHIARLLELSAAGLASELETSDAKSEAKMRVAAGRLAFAQGDYEVARQFYEYGLAIFRERGDENGAGGALNGLGVVAFAHGDYLVAHSLLEESLSVRRTLGDKSGMAFSLNNLGLVAANQGDFANARNRHEESLAFRRELQDTTGIAQSLNNLGNIAIHQGDYVNARSLLEESLDLRRRLGDKSGVSAALNNLANIAIKQGDYVSARPLLEESLAVCRALGDKNGAAFSLNNLGVVATNQSDFATARPLYEESLAIRRELGDKYGIANSLGNLGVVATYRGDCSIARNLLKESLTLFCEQGDKRGIFETLHAFSNLCLATQAFEAAATLWGASEAVRESIGGTLPHNARTEDAENAQEARSALGEAAFSSAWSAGRALTVEQAVDFALKQE